MTWSMSRRRPHLGDRCIERRERARCKERPTLCARLRRCGTWESERWARDSATVNCAVRQTFKLNCSSRLPRYVLGFQYSYIARKPKADTPCVEVPWGGYCCGTAQCVGARESPRLIRPVWGHQPSREKRSLLAHFSFSEGVISDTVTAPCL